MTTKAAMIRKILDEEYPHGLKYGDTSAIAARVGTDKYYVSKVMAMRRPGLIHRKKRKRPRTLKHLSGNSTRFKAPRTNPLYDVIARRYPCGVLPTGASSALAREFGVSRQRVSQIVKALEVEVIRQAQIRARRFCAGGCGKNIGQSKNDFCLDCRRVTLTCDRCHAEFRRPIGQIRARASNKGAKGQANYCSRECQQAAWRANLKTYGRNNRGRLTAPRFAINCRHCGTEKIVTITNKKLPRFCNRECFDAYRKENKRSGNPQK